MARRILSCSRKDIPYSFGNTLEIARSFPPITGLWQLSHNVVLSHFNWYLPKESLANRKGHLQASSLTLYGVIFLLTYLFDFPQTLSPMVKFSKAF